MTDQHFTIRELQIAAVGWDAAVAACRYEDGTPVEFAEVVNPYRESGNQFTPELIAKLNGDRGTR